MSIFKNLPNILKNPPKTTFNAKNELPMIIIRKIIYLNGIYSGEVKCTVAMGKKSRARSNLAW